MTSLQDLDRTLFEYLRLEIVRLGYLPDWKALTGTLAERKALYEQQKATIKQQKGVVIDIFSQGSGESLGAKDVAMIYILRKTVTNSDEVASWGIRNIEKIENTANYRITKYPARAKDVMYEIRLFTDTTKIERVIFDAVFAALGELSFKALWDSVTGSFLTDCTAFICFNAYNSIELETGVEYVLNYSVKDVYVTPFLTIEETVVPISTVNIEILDEITDVELSNITITNT